MSMELDVGTVAGNMHRIYQMTGKVSSTAAHQSLNEILKVNDSNETQDDLKANRTLGWFVVGNGAVAKGTSTLSTAKRTDTDLKNRIPFKLVKEKDIDSTFDKYRLRTKEIHNGEEYIAFYAKEIEIGDILVKLLTSQGDNEYLDSVSRLDDYTIKKRDAHRAQPDDPANPDASGSTPLITTIGISMTAKIGVNSSEVKEYFEISKNAKTSDDKNVLYSSGAINLNEFGLVLAQDQVVGTHRELRMAEIVHIHVTPNQNFASAAAAIVMPILYAGK